MRDFPADALIVSQLGRQAYLPCLNAMQQYTHQRTSDHPNQIWLLEHFPVFTQGKLSQASDILYRLPHPLVDTDRGGQITYHGPGQLIAYLLLDIQSSQALNALVTDIEQLIIRLLRDLHIQAEAHTQHRGVYIAQAKIASIGLRMRHHKTYHGFSLNVDMDLSPFDAINPCGKPQSVTQIREHSTVAMPEVYARCIREIAHTWIKTS
jgi:lipoyl(octanoyl) transferase